jgi:predicted short-subunit dehydrogenase-like oxidoreductase (DUF2520 family)
MNKTITIIGSGNVATQLGSALYSEGFDIVQVISKTLKNAKELARHYQAKASSNINDLIISDIVLIAVNDDSIAEVVEKIFQHQIYTHQLKPLILHTSGTCNSTILKNKNWESGIFYPLQTITKTQLIDFRNVPIIYFSENKKTLSSIKKIATSISQQTVVMNDEQRVALHTAAVFTNNFTNHLIAIAQDICKQNGINFKLLEPLLAETFEKLLKKTAFNNQTGPALRNDTKTIKKHVQLLQSSNYIDVYEIITKQIQQMHLHKSLS